jgi:hypothetical protein
MSEIHLPNPESQIETLRLKVVSLEIEKKELVEKLKESQENVEYFKHKYFKAAKLGERITSSEDVSEN